jgi:hypothetical protein
MSATNHSGPTIHTALVLSIQPSSTSPHPPPPTHAYARIAQPLPPKVMAAFPIVLISNAAKKKRRSPAYFQMQVQVGKKTPLWWLTRQRKSYHRRSALGQEQPVLLLQRTSSSHLELKESAQLPTLPTSNRPLVT